MERVVRRLQPGWVLVAGDFNARSADWGCPVTDTRGEMLGDWAAALDLHVLNRGSVPTCVAARGSSIVDIAMGSPEAHGEITDWSVSDEETLSDHRYILMEVSSPTPVREPCARPAEPEGAPPRWSLKHLNPDLALAAALAKSWETPPEEVDVEEEAAWFRGAMSQICDTAMPRRRTGGPPKKKAVYWWTPEIASLRAECNSARRQYTRYRRRRRAAEEEAARLYQLYRAAKKALQAAIATSKANAWGELLETLDGDPWGRPYRLVRNKLRQAAPPTTESLDPGFLKEVVAALFPTDPEEEARPRDDPALVSERTRWSEDLRVTEEELARAVRRMRRKNAAPGPDGVPGRVVAIALNVLGTASGVSLTAVCGWGGSPNSGRRPGSSSSPNRGSPRMTPLPTGLSA
ncbi:uncharacterized protein LOC120360037 [Solenopsis invicta]|uniref:uncharacterized protein LOC120360037 n=1 Tax=Solenopsis invicta TaxID=13686 RepID=UPI00193D9585|nr:uncharacterized protein LOC120360037 [Solenopsis invicta]